MRPITIKNVAFYAFFNPTFDLKFARALLHEHMRGLEIKGTILLAPEGINCSLCGITEKMDAFLDLLFETINIAVPDLKITYSEELAFKRSLVKVKPCIVAKPGATPIDLTEDRAPYLSPEDLCQWIKDNKKMVILDTRNDYEYRTGHFRNSLHLGTKHFADFEDTLQKAPAEWQNTTVVTFCTGGIRCEKAAPLMRKKGFKDVYQLDGGILNYFKRIGRDFFEGECFVFDERIAL